MSTLQVLHCDPLVPGADRELNQLIDDFDVVTGGTYRSLRPGGRLVAQGTVVRNGKSETLGHRKTWKRGGVAVLQDGTIVVDRMAGGTLSDIRCRFGQPDNPVVQFLGGGAVMVENGKKIQSTDVHGRQRLQRRQGSGLNAPEMAVDNHVTVGIQAGMCVVATAMNRSGHQIYQQHGPRWIFSALNLSEDRAFFLCDDEWIYRGRAHRSGYSTRSLRACIALDTGCGLSRDARRQPAHFGIVVLKGGQLGEFGSADCIENSFHGAEGMQAHVWMFIADQGSQGIPVGLFNHPVLLAAMARTAACSSVRASTKMSAPMGPSARLPIDRMAALLTLALSSWAAN